MPRRYKLAVCCLSYGLALAAALAGCSNASPDNSSTSKDASSGGPTLVSADRALELADPFFGTGGKGFGYGASTPAVQLPNGMVKLGPDTAGGESSLFTKEHFSGYHHGDEYLRGFSHTHLVGTGVPGRGHLRWTPAAGLPEGSPGAHRIRLNKQTERAEPGHYTVEAAAFDVRAELTATARAGFQRYTTDEERLVLLFDATSTVDPDRTVRGTIRRRGATLHGRVSYTEGFTARSGRTELFYSTSMDPAPDRVIPWNGDGLQRNSQLPISGRQAGVALVFENPDAPLEIRTGISYVDAEHAATHREDEVGGRSFQEVRNAAEEAWRNKLGRVRIGGGTEQLRRVFYSALYNVWRMPTIFEAHDDQYRGLDGEVHSAEDFRYVTDLSLWDTFRTLHPWLTLVDPELQRDSVESLIRMGRDGGYIPRWPAGRSYTNAMLGDSAAMVIAGSALKGIEGPDYGRAYELLAKTARSAPPDDHAFTGRRYLDPYLEHGYVPYENRPQSVSSTLEYAWADWAIANLAGHLGREGEDAFRQRGSNWKNVFEPESAYMRRRGGDGSFLSPFSSDSGEGFTEGNARHWRFYAFHQPGELKRAFGGPEALGTALEDFFSSSAFAESGRVNASLPNPYYWHGNEHDLHSAYLFRFSGRPDRAADWIRRIQFQAYAPSPNGLQGNDDGGTLSSWFLFSALGFYPIAGGNRYIRGTPLFPRLEIRRDGRTVLEVRAPGADRETKYVDSLTVDGEPVSAPYLEHGRILGSTLRFEMSESY
ncbi:MAG: GH92 family glycosyl hydrolase [Bradymonadaceae bacterium]